MFVFLLGNITLWPVFSNMSYRLVLLLCNFFEYGLCLLTIICVGLSFSKKRDNIVRMEFIIFFLFFIHAVFVSLLFSPKTKETLSSLLRIFVCICVFISSYHCFINKKKLIIAIIASIISVAILYFSSIIYNLHSLSNLKEAFTGGTYRLGNLESQANGYALYCFYLSAIFIYLYFYKEKKWILLMTIVPFFICLGTQSKKGILICGVLVIFAVFILIYNVKNHIVRFTLYISIPFLLLSAAIIVITKTNILNRFFLENDDSTQTRFMMFRFLFEQLDKTFLVGNGANTFNSYFYLNNGTDLIFHSTLGDSLFSYGAIGLFLYVCSYIVFYRQLFIFSRKKQWLLFIIIYLICQLLNDFTAISWYFPFSFVFIAALQAHKQIIDQRCYSCVAI